MCRWFAYISPAEECLLEDVLIIPAHALSKQVHDSYLPKLISHTPEGYPNAHEVAIRNKFNNVDGFGIVWYTPVQAKFNQAQGYRPAMYKSGMPPTNDFNFHSICANTSAKTCFGHIRSATATPVTPVNSHPFVWGRHAIMHNGVITDFLEIRRPMSELVGKSIFAGIQGSTDSEHLAALYMTFLVQHSSNPDSPDAWQESYPVTAMAEALWSAIQAMIKLQVRALGGTEHCEANSLNIACTDGEQLVTLRFRNHATEQPPSLYYSDRAGITLNRKYPGQADGPVNPDATKEVEEHGKHVVVASEPTTYKVKEWNLIPKNHFCLVGTDGVPKLQGVEVPEELVAKAKTTHMG